MPITAHIGNIIDGVGWLFSATFGNIIARGTSEFRQLSATLMTTPSLSRDDFFPILTRAEMVEVTRLVGEIDEFKGKWRRFQEIRADRLAGLRQVATIESAASSTRMEGAELSDDEVARVLGGLHVDSFRSRDEAEVRGYGELMELVFASHDELALTENHIKQLHAVLLRHTTRDERHRGEYKKVSNDVVARHPDGHTEILFQTTSPFDTPQRMAELIDATNDAFTDGTIPPLIVTARFIVDFLAIHPFQDGNGRLSRALTTLLLLRSGYEYVPYASHERIIEENKARYYAALRESQLAMRENHAAFGEWTLYFLGALRAQKRSLEAKVDVERAMLQLSDVQEKIVSAARTQGRVTTSGLATQLGLPTRTVRYHLDLLVARQLLKAHGEKKGRYYTAGGGGATAPPSRDPGTNAMIAEIYEHGGRIGKRALSALVKKHGYDGRVVGILHGRRQPHLRRDKKTGESVVTARGEEVAREFLFTKRLAEGARVALERSPTE